MPFVKGQSGNPDGRPKGIIDKRQRMQKAIGESADELLAVIKTKALEGDMHAAGLLLSRLVPTLKPESGDRVQFEFDSTKPLGDQLAAITQAIADGELTLEQGRQFVEIAEHLARARALEGGDDGSAIVNALKEFASSKVTT